MISFVTYNLTKVITVIARDSEIDGLHNQVCKRLMTTMTNDPTLVEPGTLLLWVSHNFERIGDRATNTARRVGYLVKGELNHSSEVTE